MTTGACAIGPAPRTVILAAGDFPAAGSEPERLLKAAHRVIACDSAANAYREHFGKLPDFTVGDFDSLGFRRPSSRFVVRRDPGKSDLTKAIAFCRGRGWDDLVIVGAGGKREDHAIGNVFRALAEAVPVVSEFGEFVPVGKRLTLRTWKNQGVSVFAVDPAVRMKSHGLKWKLDGVRFENPFCATLNRATGERMTVTSDRPAMVYLERPAAVTRAVVSLGSNLGRRERQLDRALRELAAINSTRLLDFSSIRETEPVGVPPEFADKKFLNAAAVLETTLSPLAFARKLHAIEAKLGRVRTVRNGPRPIDLDLILFGSVRMNTKELVLPHPRAQARAFVLEPLNELGCDQFNDCVVYRTERKF